mgnify:CR=1 FL=1
MFGWARYALLVEAWDTAILSCRIVETLVWVARVWGTAMLRVAVSVATVLGLMTLVAAQECAPDLNSDGLVNTDDLLFLLATFGRTVAQGEDGSVAALAALDGPKQPRPSSADEPAASDHVGRTSPLPACARCTQLCLVSTLTLVGVFGFFLVLLNCIILRLLTKV